MANNKSAIELMINIIFGTEIERLSKERDEIIKANAELNKDGSIGFHFQGVIFGAKKLGNGIGVLNPELVERTQSFLNDSHTIMVDKIMVSQILLIILDECICPQDIRDAMPTCMDNDLEKIYELPRTRPEAWCIQDNPQALKQYENLRNKILIYMTARYIY